jgi:hypothetical protein
VAVTFCAAGPHPHPQDLPKHERSMNTYAVIPLFQHQTKPAHHHQQHIAIQDFNNSLEETRIDPALVWKRIN